MATLESYLQEQIRRVDAALDQLLPAESLMPHSLHRAMRYSVFAGGKRLRPVLVLAACEALGGDSERALPVACAFEMVHTYSLIHDDLPAMDDDDLRRGRPTNHKIFGEATAILAGDALLTEAFSVLAGVDFDPAVRVRLVALLAQAAGAAGMVGGQVVDMESEGQSINLPVLEYIHTHKTGALLLASVQAGALVGGADDDSWRALTRYGEAAGLAFQIADDILDVTATSEQIGKDAGSDEARQKATYPALLGLDEARQRADELMSLARDALAPFGDAAWPLRELAHYIVTRTN